MALPLQNSFPPASEALAAPNICACVSSQDGVNLNAVARAGRWEDWTEEVPPEAVRLPEPVCTLGRGLQSASVPKKQPGGLVRQTPEASRLVFVNNSVLQPWFPALRLLFV